MKKLIRTEVKTTPKGIKMGTKPDNVKKKSVVKVVRKYKLARGQNFNMKNVESNAAQTDENVMRKQDRMRKGL